MNDLTDTRDRSEGHDTVSVTGSSATSSSDAAIRDEAETVGILLRLVWENVVVLCSLLGGNSAEGRVVRTLTLRRVGRERRGSTDPDRGHACPSGRGEVSRLRRRRLCLGRSSRPKLEVAVEGAERG